MHNLFFESGLCTASLFLECSVLVFMTFVVATMRSHMPELVWRSRYQLTGDFQCLIELVVLLISH